MEQTLDIVKKVLVSTLGIEDRADSIDRNTELFGSLPELDSMSVVELIVAIEEAMDIRIDDGAMVEDAFETLESLAAMIKRQKEDQRPPLSNEDRSIPVQGPLALSASAYQIETIVRDELVALTQAPSPTLALLAFAGAGAIAYGQAHSKGQSGPTLRSSMTRRLFGR